MLLNADTMISIRDRPTILVPYTPKHVPKYHTWMQDPQILHFTASEPQTLLEEQENQKSWREDNHKLTFIVLDGSRGPHFMAGDVNLYIIDAESENENTDVTVAEIEVMVAEVTSRRKGLAKDALMSMMAYAAEFLHVQVFIAKILEGNNASIRLFENALNFVKYRYVKAFGEIHLKRKVDDTFQADLLRLRDHWTLETYQGSKVQTSKICNDEVKSEIPS